MKATVKLDDIPSWSEVKKLVGQLRKNYERKKSLKALRNFLLISLLALTGIRLGELLLIEKKDINLKQGIARIRQLKKRQDVRREILIPPSILPYLKTYCRYVNGRLFKMTKRNARAIIHTYTKRYLGRRIRPHAFRHSYALRIIEKTKDIELLRRLLGHSGYQVLKIYLNYTIRDRKDEVLEAIESEV